MLMVRAGWQANHDSVSDHGRRDLLFAFLGVSAGVLAGVSGVRADPHWDSGDLGEWLHHGGADYFPDLTALRRLGAMYLMAHPEEGSCLLLSHLLIAGDVGTIPSRLWRAVARDWSGNHVAVVDGWLLSRAEARLCAFLHLDEGARV